MEADRAEEEGMSPMNLSPSHLIVWQFGHGGPLLLGRRPQQCVHRVKDHSEQRGRAQGSSPPGGGGSSHPSRPPHSTPLLTTEVAPTHVTRFQSPLPGVYREPGAMAANVKCFALNPAVLSDVCGPDDQPASPDSHGLSCSFWLLGPKESPLGWTRILLASSPREPPLSTRHTLSGWKHAVAL